MGTPAEDAAYQSALTSYRVWCDSAGQMPDPGYLDQLARLYNQIPAGMPSATPQPTAPVVPGGGAPAIPAAPAATPVGQAPTDWDALRAMFPPMPDDEWNAMVNAAESMGIDVQYGFEWFKLWIETGASKYARDLEYEVGMANVEANQVANEIAQQNADTMRFYNEGLLEEMAKSREQEAVLARELNALNQYIAEMQNQVATLGLQISERAYGAQLGAHPVNTVEFELWKRAGGSLEPVEIPEAPTPVAPTVPTTAAPAAPTVPTAPTVPGAQRGLSIYSPKGNVPVKTSRPGELHTTGEEGWEYLRPGPGTVVAPRAKGETQPTQAGGQRAISRQLGGTSVNAYRPPTGGKPAGGKRVPYGWMKRRQALGFQGGSVPGAQYGYPDPGTHTDEEMAAMFAGAIKGWPHLYNPNLRGTGQFGAIIPGPQEMGRRRYYSMDPSEHDILTSFLTGGLRMPSGEMGASIAEDWLRQMQRSWIPGLEGAKRSVQYAY